MPWEASEQAERELQVYLGTLGPQKIVQFVREGLERASPRGFIYRSGQGQETVNPDGSLTLKFEKPHD